MLVLAAVLSLLAADTGADTLTREYMLCVRRNAVRLEPSGDPPGDVARAAVFACQPEEAALFAMLPQEANQLRATAIFFGTGQAVSARLCRKTKDCGVTPLGH